MKKLIILCVTFLLALGIATNRAHSEVPPLDLGESNLLNVACNLAYDNVEAAGFHMLHCRRSAPDVINGNQAIIFLSVSATGDSKAKVKVYFRRSLWWPSAIVQIN